MKRAPLLLALALVITACSDFSPTAPRLLEVAVTRSALNGSWRGSMRISPGGEDWSSVTFDITPDVATMTPKSGRRHPVTVSAASGFATLVIGELPVDPGAPCIGVQIFVRSMVIDGTRAVTLNGEVQGRCPSTLMTSIRLDRV